MKTAMILGGATCVFDDIENALKMFTPDCVIAINDIGAQWKGQMDHWVSLHPGRWGELIARRAKNNLPMTFERWSYTEGNEELLPTLNIFPDYKPSGLSGLYAIKVAREKVDATHIVLCGVPMDKSGHFTGDVTKHWISLHRRESWLARSEELKIVRSMSGWTMELCGKPTLDWFKVVERA